MVTKRADTREAVGPGSGAPCLHPLLFTALVVASIGGPLALVAVQVPASSGAAARFPLVTLAGTLLWVAPIAVWYGYARRIASAGGLTAFVEAAAGRRVAAVQAVFWIVSYGLYIVYTIPQVVYELLPAAVTIPAWTQPILALGTAAAVGGIALLPLRWAVSVAAVPALAQVVLVLLLAGAVFPHPAPAAPPPPAFGAASVATAQASLFYVCGSLPLFLGGETRGGARVASRGLLAGFAVAAVVVLIGVTATARAGIDGDAALPGEHLLARVGAGGLGVAVGVGAAVSTAVIILAEFLAMTRLVHHLFEWPVRRVAAVMAAALVAATALTLVNPIGIYEALLKPSLIALWLAQLIVFAAYPLYRARTEPGRGRRGGVTVAVVLATVASALAVFGLVSVTILPAGS